MIQSELLREGTLIKQWSDRNVLIRQVETGAEYGEAIDIYPCPFTYEETNTPIDPEEDATEEDYQNQLERLGVNFE